MSANEYCQLLFDIKDLQVKSPGIRDDCSNPKVPFHYIPITLDNDEREIEPLEEEVTKPNKYERSKSSFHNQQCIIYLHTANSIVDKKDKSCFWLLFKETKEGSRKAGIIGEMAAIFGAAILGLPYNLKETGLILGGCFILLGALINYLSIKCLMNVSYRKNLNSYSECVYQTLGKFAGRVFEYSMIFHLFCAFVNYQMLGNNSI